MSQGRTMVEEALVGFVVGQAAVILLREQARVVVPQVCPTLSWYMVVQGLLELSATAIQVTHLDKGRLSPVKRMGIFICYLSLAVLVAVPVLLREAVEAAQL